MLRIDYRAEDLSALLWWENADRSAPWLPLLRRLILDSTPSAKQEAGQVLALPWWNFVALRRQVQEILTTYDLRAAARSRLRGQRGGDDAPAPKRAGRLGLPGGDPRGRDRRVGAA